MAWRIPHEYHAPINQALPKAGASMESTPRRPHPSEEFITDTRLEHLPIVQDAI